MKSKKLVQLIKKNDLVIPGILLTLYKELKLDLKELLVLAFLMSFRNDIFFDVTYFSEYLGLSSLEIMNTMSCLCEKKLVEMVVKKDDKRRIKEYINLDLLYNKLALLVIEEEEETDSASSNIYSVIEKEFGRTLSPIEYETIKGWLDSKIGEDLIYQALKEAVLNGVTSLKYIYKILCDWTKKGYKKPQDIKRRKGKEEEVPDLFEYDWLEDDE